MRRPLMAACLLCIVVIWMILNITDEKASGAYLPEEESVIYVQGTVYRIDDSKIWLQSVSLYSTDTSLFVSQNQIPYSFTNIICETSDLSFLSPGCLVTVVGTFMPYSEARNPGEFDSFSYYRSLRVGGRVKQAQIVRAYTSTWHIRKAAWQFRTLLSDRIQRLYPSQQAGVLCALLLGEKEELDDDLKQLYKENGILHILSISSLHITLLGIGLYKLLRRGGVPMNVAAVSSGILLLFYGCMVGFTVSACRAIGMFLIRMLGECIGRTYDLLTAMAILGVVMTVSNPYYLQNLGFLLSFTAVFGVGLVSPLLGKKERKRRYQKDSVGKRLTDFILKRAGEFRDLFLSGLLIMLFTLPIQLTYFYEVPLYSFLVNPFILPFMPMLLACGFLSLLPACGAVGQVNILILKWYSCVCLFFQNMVTTGTKEGVVSRVHRLCSALVWNPGKPSMLQMVIYYMILFLGIGLLYRRKKHKKKAYCLLAAVPLLILLLGKNLHGTDRLLGTVYGNRILQNHFAGSGHIWFLDVGQGDCALMQLASGEVYLFDCGSSSKRNVGERVLLPCLKYYGIHQIDAVFLSHPDTDHMSGILELAGLAEENRIQIGQFVIPAVDDRYLETEFEKLFAAVEEGGSIATVYGMGAGDAWQVQKASFICLHPEKNDSVISSNAYSLCIYCDLGEITLLFTGDVEETGEQELTGELARRGIDDVTVLKCAHHGSRYSTSDSFLEQIHPKVAVISSGKNSYGHPHEETLERLNKQGSVIYRTEESGAVIMEYSGRNLTTWRYGE